MPACHAAPAPRPAASPAAAPPALALLFAGLLLAAPLALAGEVTVRSWPPLAEAVTSFGACAVDGTLYRYGGHVGRAHDYCAANVRGDLFALSPGATEWERLASGRPLQGSALAGTAGQLFRVGGLAALNEAGEPQQLESVATVERFDLAQRRFEALPPLPAARSSHDALWLDGTLLVVGGWCIDAKGRRHHDTSVRLDLAAPQPRWQPFAAPVTPRRAAALAAAGDFVVVIGGMDDAGTMLRSVERLDRATWTWHPAPDFPCDAFGAAAVGHDGAIYASARDGVVWRLTAACSAWERVGEWFAPRYFHRLVVQDGALVALGGTGPSGPLRLVESLALPAAGSPARRTTLQTFDLELPGRARNRQAALRHGAKLLLAGGNGSTTQHAFGPDDFVDEVVEVSFATLQATLAGRLPAGRQSQALAEADAASGVAARAPLLLGGFGYEESGPGASGAIVTFTAAADGPPAFTTSPLTLPEPRTQFHATWHGDALWIAAGWDYQEARDPAARYPLELWRAAAGSERFEKSALVLPRPRRAAGAARLGDRWCFVGGLDPEFGPIVACDVINLATGTWSTIEPPLEPRVGPELLAWRDRLVLVGGSLLGSEGAANAAGRIERFDPASGRWSTWIADLPFPLRHLRALPWGDALLLFAPLPGTPRTLRFGLLREE